MYTDIIGITLVGFLFFCIIGSLYAPHKTAERQERREEEHQSKNEEWALAQEAMRQQEDAEEKAAAARAVTTIEKHRPKHAPSPLKASFAASVKLGQFCYELFSPLDGYEAKTQYQENCRKLGWPQDYNGLEPERFFKGTPFERMAKVPMPYPLFDETRFMHHHVLGDTGTSKTTLLSHLILKDIERVPSVSVVVLDSQKRMLDGFAKLSQVVPYYIGPRHPIGLNLFKLGNPEATASILSYAFGSLFDTQATPLQAAPMRYAIKALCFHPHANLNTLQDFLRNPKKYQSTIEKADPHTQEYFKYDFKLRDDTKQGILGRINYLRENAVLDAMLNAATLDLNLPKVLQKGSVVLFDANKAEFGGKERTQVFGRLVIALMNYAAQQRMTEDEKSLKPCFFYMDEAHDYIANDPSFIEMMEQARSKRIGLIVSHHHDGQLSPAVQNGLRMAAIQTQCVERGVAHFTIKGRKTRVAYPRFEYPSQISNHEFFNRYYPETYPAYQKKHPDIKQQLDREQGMTFDKS